MSGYYMAHASPQEWPERYYRSPHRRWRPHRGTRFDRDEASLAEALEGFSLNEPYGMAAHHATMPHGSGRADSSYSERRREYGSRTSPSSRRHSRSEIIEYRHEPQLVPNPGSLPGPLSASASHGEAVRAAGVPPPLGPGPPQPSMDVALYNRHGPPRTPSPLSYDEDDPLSSASLSPRSERRTERRGSTGAHGWRRQVIRPPIPQPDFRQYQEYADDPFYDANLRHHRRHATTTSAFTPGFMPCTCPNCTGPHHQRQSGQWRSGIDHGYYPAHHLHHHTPHHHQHHHQLHHRHSVPDRGQLYGQLPHSAGHALPLSPWLMTSPGHHLHPHSHWHSARRGGYDSRSDEYDSDSDGSYASGDDRRRSDVGHYRVPRSHSLGRRRYSGNAYRDGDSDHEQSDSASYTGHERYDNYSDDGY